MLPASSSPFGRVASSVSHSLGLHRSVSPRDYLPSTLILSSTDSLSYSHTHTARCRLFYGSKFALSRLANLLTSHYIVRGCSCHGSSKIKKKKPQRDPFHSLVSWTTQWANSIGSYLTSLLRDTAFAIIQMIVDCVNIASIWSYSGQNSSWIQPRWVFIECFF